jgi:hypothetical protein
MKLKYEIKKTRDKLSEELYWASPERYNMEAFQKGFDAAIDELIKIRMLDPALVIDQEADKNQNI